MNFPFFSPYDDLKKNSAMTMQISPFPIFTTDYPEVPQYLFLCLQLWWCIFADVPNVGTTSWPMDGPVPYPTFQIKYEAKILQQRDISADTAHPIGHTSWSLLRRWRTDRFLWNSRRPQDKARPSFDPIFPPLSFCWTIPLRGKYKF
jgi:hypothetical protein